MNLPKISSNKAKELRRLYISKEYKYENRSFGAFCKSKYGISKTYAYKLVNGNNRTYKKSISEALRWEIWERDNFTCQICGKRRFLNVDHIIPESRGGTLDKENLQTLCKKCNSSKSNKTYL